MRRNRQGVVFGVVIVLALAILSGWLGYQLHSHLSASLERIAFAVMVGSYIFSGMTKVVIAGLQRLIDERTK